MILIIPDGLPGSTWLAGGEMSTFQTKWIPK